MTKNIILCPAIFRSELDQPPSNLQVDQQAKTPHGGNRKTESSPSNGKTSSSFPESSSLKGHEKQRRRNHRRGSHRHRRRIASTLDLQPEGPADSKAENQEEQVEGSSQSPDRSSGSTSSEHRQSIEGEEEENDVVVEEEQGVPLGQAEIFHFLRPAQKGEEPADVPEKVEASGAGVGFYFHPDGERYAAERRSHYHNASKATEVKKVQTPGASSVTLGNNILTSVDSLGQEKIQFEKHHYGSGDRCIPGQIFTIPLPAESHGFPSGSLTGRIGINEKELASHIRSLELEKHSLKKVLDDLRAAFSELDCQFVFLEKSLGAMTLPTTLSDPHKNQGSAEGEDEEQHDADLCGRQESLTELSLKQLPEKKIKKARIIRFWSSFVSYYKLYYYYLI